MSDNTLERLVYLIKCWYICRKKERVCIFKMLPKYVFLR